MKKLLVFTFILALITPQLYSQTVIKSADNVDVEVSDISKISTIGGSITEIVYALGFGDNVIGTDVSSTYPPQIFALPRLPYVRNLTAEGILSVESSLIIASDEANPATAVQQIRDAGTDIILIKDEEHLEGVIHKISTIGVILGAKEQAEVIIEENKRLHGIAEDMRPTLDSKPKVMFILSARGGSSFMVAGTNTGAQHMIELAGGENAFYDFEGYKNVSNESIIAANPDYILMMASRAEGAAHGIKNTEGINMINAVKNDNIIAMDGNYLLGFGPRFGAAIISLMEELHPETTIEL